MGAVQPWVFRAIGPCLASVAAGAEDDPRVTLTYRRLGLEMFVVRLSS